MIGNRDGEERNPRNDKTGMRRNLTDQGNANFSLYPRKALTEAMDSSEDA
jgi:hypothetical protein